MTTKEILNAIDFRIATLAINSEQHRKSGNIKPDELYMCYSQEIAYQECRNIISKAMEESKND